MKRKVAKPPNVAEMEIRSVRFKRSKNSPIEAGVLVSDKVIIDMLGKPVPVGLWWFDYVYELYVVYHPRQLMTEKGSK